AVSTAQVFLGTRLQCAQCHNHPYERWTMDDYYNWTTLFARVDYKVVENRRRDTNDKHEFVGEQIVFIKDTGGVSHPRTGRDAKARFLGAKDIDPDNTPDRLEALATWLTAPENKQFARAQANRVWFHLFGRGIVDPVDDFRSTNLPSHPELLDRLAAELIKSGYDLRQLIRTIAGSRTYQASSTPNETNREDDANFSRATVRRLTAEQMLDAESQFTGVPLEFNGYPSGTRATQIPGVDSIRRRNRAGSADQFLAVFGKPPRLIPSECERSGDTTMGQAFQLISGPTVHSLLSRTANRLDELLKSGRSNAEIIDEVYWSALSRPASKTELDALEKHMAGSTDRRAALEDISWALLNAKEFVFRK
ncbi:MAG TPA: DUF1553 domain-containing protein, partial [Roseimicrobium sp.]|nr:DUF1553 domain-containing protein [Roseimicrobium sp.]